jgi:predicted membrane GTPase involved in stress response
MIVGETARQRYDQNPCREKKLTNMWASGTTITSFEAAASDHAETALNISKTTNSSK